MRRYFSGAREFEGWIASVTGGLKVLNLGGIKMPTFTAFGFETKGCVDAEIGELSHVERTARTGIEHQPWMKPPRAPLLQVDVVICFFYDIPQMSPNPGRKMARVPLSPFSCC
jgi:hypothetical protein